MYSGNCRGYQTKIITDISMEVQDVDSSVSATLTCLITDVSDLLNVTWFRDNRIITSESGGYLAIQGRSTLEHP